MSLHPQPFTAVPPETARVARAAFPQGNLYMHMRDELGAIYEDVAFASLFATRGQPAEAPWRLALVTIMQYAEGLSDRQAADAVRSRIDWKYALNLELTDPGFDPTVLCEFRARLLAGHAEQLLLDTLLQRCRERQLLKARGRQRTDSTHVLGAIRALNRLECIGETLRHALNSLAVIAPQWLRGQSQPQWVDRYGPRVAAARLPASKEAQATYAHTMGQDGAAILAAIYAADAPSWLREVPAVRMLQRVWVQQYYTTAEELRWRTEADGIPPARVFLSSPYDEEAHLARKDTTQWVGYKVHLTENCDEELPRLITHVETTTGPIADGAVTPVIHHALQEKGLLPATHLVDTGYLDAELLVTSQRDYHVDLLGPTRSDYHWQARAGQGFAVHNFQLDWDRHQALCPTGRTSVSWTPAVDNRATEVIKIKFSRKDCRACESRLLCTRSARRTVTVRRHDHYLALQAARQRETSAAYGQQYAKRAGIEGTISQGVRRCRLRRTRYIGLAKTHLQHIVTAAALNFVRLSNWLAGTPLAKTRRSSFVRLMMPLAAH